MKRAHQLITGLLAFVLALALWPATGAAEIERMVIKIYGSMICSL